MNNKEGILDYNYNLFNFKNLIKKNFKDNINVYFKNDKKKKIVNKIKSIQNSKSFHDLYNKFIKSEIAKLFPYRIAYQKFANIRVLMQDDLDSVVPFHCDKWYNHSPDETNFWIPLHDVGGSESLQFVGLQKSKKIEKIILKKRLSYEEINNVILKSSEPIKCKYGQMLRFSPLNLHGNKVNKTNLPRISIDFRVKKLNSRFHKKLLGGYFEIL